MFVTRGSLLPYTVIESPPFGTLDRWLHVVLLDSALVLVVNRVSEPDPFSSHVYFRFQFLMKYLAMYDGATAAELAEVKAAAVRGCIGAVKSPIVSFTEQVRRGIGTVVALIAVYFRG